MRVHIRFDGDTAILSHFGPLLNDPRHFDAGRDVEGVLDQGYRKFILELTGLREMGSTALGLLLTLTRQVRKRGGEAVLVNRNPAVETYIDQMAMDSYWDLFTSVEEAREFFQGRPA